MDSIPHSLSLPILFSLLFLARPALSVDSPSLPPQLPADEFSPSPSLPTHSPASSPAPSVSSPPAPPPSDLAPSPHSLAPSPHEGGAARRKPPSPAPGVAGDVSHENQASAADLDAKEESSSGVNSGQKAGVAIGVIGGACLVGAGALVYKKRQQNIRRSQYGYAARREIL